MAARLEMLKEQFFDDDGAVLSGGKLNTYEVGTTTAKATYTTATGDVEQANPVVLDSDGRIPSDLYGVGYYAINITDSADVAIDTIPSVCGINTTSLTTIGDYSDDFDDAITSISTTKTTLYVDSAATMSAVVTVPATCTVVMLKGGSIDMGGNALTFTGALIMQGGTFTHDATLTINGSFECGIYDLGWDSAYTLTFGAGSVIEVYPQWWGATGNGTTDDSSALNAFFASATGKTALIPDGTYMAKNLEIMSNTHVKGESYSAVIKTVSTAEIDDHLLRLNEKTNVIIEGLKLDGNMDNTVGSDASGVTMLYVYGGCTNIVIKNNIIIDNDYVAIRITDLDAGGSTAANITIDGNIIDDTDCGVITGHQILTNLNIVNNIIRNGASEGVSIWGHTTTKQGEKYINIANNIIHDKTGGVQLRWANFVAVTGNTIYNCVSGIYFYPTSTYSSEITVTGNNIEDSSGSGISGVVEDSIISGNTIIDSDGCGIWLKDLSKNTIVSNNNIKNADIGDASADGIRIEDSTNITVIGNTYTDDTTYAYAGIRIMGATGTGDKCTVIGNHIKDTATYGIYIVDVDDVHVFDNYVEGSGTANYFINANVTNVITKNNWSDNVLWEYTEVITASGALSLDKASSINSSGGVLALTLADGSVIGQLKAASMVTAGNAANLTIAHHETEDDEVATFDAADEYLLLIWTGTEWATVANSCTFD